jgi:flavin-dependent thymidylate synthase
VLNPVITLVNFTPHPVEMMMMAFKNMHGQIPNTLEEFIEKEQISSSLRKDFVEYCAAEPLTGGVQEFVSTVWNLKNVSRAFQQQLTRHRTAAYSIQSLRIVKHKNFAGDFHYHVPPNVKDEKNFHSAMLNVEYLYDDLIDVGELAEVARGILPLNIYSPITMCINLRNLSSLLSSRLCLMAQGEFQDVARMMIEEVVTKMGEEFAVLFSAPCEPTGFCPHAEGCGHRPKFPFCEGKHKESIKEFVKRA